jgi:hypothetical protein
VTQVYRADMGTSKAKVAHRAHTVTRQKRVVHPARLAVPAADTPSTLEPFVETSVDEAPQFVQPRVANFTITHETTITGEVAEQLWEAYRLNFEPLAELAVLQHFYSRDEVLAELENPRIVKIVGWRDGVPIGLAMVTNSLEDVPQISPQFLRSRYPTHAAAQSIYFGILVMVSPEVRGRTLFARLYTELWQVAALAGGVLVFDICDFNREMFDTDTLTQRIASAFPRSSVEVLDRQTWYVAELPEALPGPAARR